MSASGPGPGGTPTLTRVEATALAERCLEHLGALLEAEDTGRLPVARGHLGLLEALKHALSGPIADLLQAEPRERGLPDVELWLRRRGWEVKHRARDRLDALLGLGAELGSARGVRAPGAPRVVLAVPRTHHHLRDMVLVAEHGKRARGPDALDVRFLTFQREHTAMLRSRGLPAVLAGAYAPRHRLERLAERADLALSSVRWSEHRPDDVDAERWRAISTLVHRGAQAHLPTAMIAAGAITRALEEVGPDVVLAGNPVTLEGRLAVRGAGSLGLPSATLQHGDFNPAHAEWGRSGVTRITAWGEGPASTLVKLGVARERIVVTGAPWADRLVVGERPVRPTPRRRVLVALSGAGHTVGLAEHTGHVRRILEASAALTEHDFVFRLHPKDRPALYEQLLAELPGARATIVEARTAGDIHEELPRVDALITVTSTSATDAMLHGVPVVTLARPAGEVPVAFVTAGATVHAAPDRPLADVLREVLERGVSAETRAAAEVYVARFFGPRDGRATERVAAALRELARAAE